jgi:hypothetical protein
MTKFVKLQQPCVKLILCKSRIILFRRHIGCDNISTKKSNFRMDRGNENIVV